MKYIILFVLFFSTAAYPQNKYDINNDGKLDNYVNVYLDINGDGEKEYVSLSVQLNDRIYTDKYPAYEFSQFWASPAGAFSNCWDGLSGYFDNDTLLDIAGYTFSPSMFYIREQSPVKPDSFYIVFQYAKSEGGGLGPIVFGDTDGDSKSEIIVADLSTMSRIYVFECDGNNQYSSKETQGSLTHTNDGKTAQSLFISDMNKNGKKEIICMRGNSSDGGNVRIWEQNGTTGSHTYTNIYNYTTPTYLFSKGGIGDSDNDGYEEVFLTFGGLPLYNTYIRRIEFDSVSSTFVHLMFQATSVGFPASYSVSDVNNDNIRELIMTGNSASKASIYIFRNTGPNSYITLDSIFEINDNNNMLTHDIKLLSGETYPSVLLGSFNGRIYIYRFNGSGYEKQYEDLNFPGPAIRRVYWLPLTVQDGFFNTWSSSSSDGTFYLFKRIIQTGIGKKEYIPDKFYLSQNYPNPFNPVTKIKFEISSFLSFPNAFIGIPLVSLKIYDILGKEITTLVNEKLNPGIYEVDFDGSNLPSGVYFYKLVAGDFTSARKMLLIK